jgi:hypothetical protein
MRQQLAGKEVRGKRQDRYGAHTVCWASERRRSALDAKAADLSVRAHVPMRFDKVAATVAVAAVARVERWAGERKRELLWI